MSDSIMWWAEHKIEAFWLMLILYIGIRNFCDFFSYMFMKENDK